MPHKTIAWYQQNEIRNATVPHEALSMMRLSTESSPSCSSQRLSSNGIAHHNLQQHCLEIRPRALYCFWVPCAPGVLVILFFRCYPRFLHAFSCPLLLPASPLCASSPLIRPSFIRARPSRLLPLPAHGLYHLLVGLCTRCMSYRASGDAVTTHISLPVETTQETKHQSFDNHALNIC